MTEEQSITNENVLDIDVEKLAMNADFGKMVFDNANKKLSKVQKWLKEADELEFNKLLIENDKNQIISFAKQLITHLEWLSNFDIGTIPNAQIEHDNFERRVDDYYNNVYQKLVMGYLPFLREEKRRQNPDEEKIEEEVRKVSRLRIGLEKELESVKADIEKIRITGKEIGTVKGARATLKTALHFNKEVEKYEKIAKKWLIGVAISYIIIIFILISLGFITYSYTQQLFVSSEVIDKSIVWGAIISKLVIVAAFWYGLSFMIKNYNVNSHLASVNRHRAAVAKTLEDFIAAEQQQSNPRLSEMLQNATKAMFKNTPVGFISKAERETGSPVLQIINDIMGVNNK